MQGLTPVPPPFSQNCQYKINQPDDGETEDPGASKESKKKKASNTNKKKKKAPAQLAKAKKNQDDGGATPAAVSQDSPGVPLYQPNTYAKTRKDFIEKLKNEGLNHQDASAGWDSSAEKRQLLSALPLPELKRRRFVSKDCQENPWAM